jgi:hypothetical protein
VSLSGGSRESEMTWKSAGKILDRHPFRIVHRLVLIIESPNVYMLSGRPPTGEHPASQSHEPQYAAQDPSFGYNI